MALSPSEKELVVITSSLSMRIYAFPSLYSSPFTKPLEPSRHIPKAHEAPIHVVTIDPSSNYIATGSADGVAKVWDLHRGYVTHVFKGHGGVISCLRFHLATPHHVDEDEEGSAPQLILATGSVDTRVRLFELGKSNLRSSNLKPLAVLDGHVSVPRGIAFSSDGSWMITAGRDSVVLLWRLNRTGTTKGSAKSKGNQITPTLTRTIPVSEAVESLGIIDNVHAIAPSSAMTLQFFIGGEKGSIQVWDAHQGRRLVTLEEEQSHQSDDARELRAIQESMYAPSPFFHKLSLISVVVIVLLQLSSCLYTPIRTFSSTPYNLFRQHVT
jgi:U3 small nucleolar RNA-associated protein 13